MAQYEVLDGDASLINSEMVKFLEVTPQQIQDVAKKYFVPGRQTVFDILPAPQKEGK